VERILRNLLTRPTADRLLRLAVPAATRLPLLFQPRDISVSVLVENVKR
jgi:hypothetical protein